MRQTQVLASHRIETLSDTASSSSDVGSSVTDSWTAQKLECGLPHSNNRQAEEPLLHSGWLQCFRHGKQSWSRTWVCRQPRLSISPTPHTPLHFSSSHAFFHSHKSHQIFNSSTEPHYMARILKDVQVPHFV